MSTTDSPLATHRITSDILNKFYPNVGDLRNYLNDLLEPSENTSQSNLVNDADSQSYRDLLNLSFVGVKKLTQKRFQFYPPMLEMRELLDQAQERLFKSKHPQNNHHLWIPPCFPCN
ncbi:hypothetical protein M413DRAFT_163224 [Hebeloma cylindrosporum]|uniref:Uncharacterized protein n=1 Tax=Hebeloma cylindrosporum TaxID=76867 RepID=A0A0C2XS19_HEBCY|nr:hypothetical protein M413DRAFT_163224 [Hebeloma cylindrosporum h7]